MIVGSLFSGAGMLEQAVMEEMGGELAWYSEIDPAASLVMAAHHPGVPNLGDVMEIDWRSVPKVDIVCLGFPCQDVSLAGKRKGVAHGTRSGLWFEALKGIRIMMPEFVFIENVRGILSAVAESHVEPESGQVDGCELRALGRVLGDLAGIGYDASWRTVRASDVGAPHRRERVFILATPHADTCGERRDGRPGADAEASGRDQPAHSAA